MRQLRVCLMAHPSSRWRRGRRVLRLDRLLQWIESSMIFAAARSCPNPSCSSRAIRRRSSSCNVIKPREKDRKRGRPLRNCFSSCVALSRIDFSRTLLSECQNSAIPLDEFPDDR